MYPTGDWLVIEKITIINNPDTDYEIQNISNLSLQIYVNPVGSENKEIAQLTNIPPLKINDTYEVTYCGQNRQYDYKINNEFITKKRGSNINPTKLSMNGWWQINVKLKPIEPLSFGHNTLDLLLIKGDLH